MRDFHGGPQSTTQVTTQETGDSQESELPREHLDLSTSMEIRFPFPQGHLHLHRKDQEHVMESRHRHTLDSYANGEGGKEL